MILIRASFLVSAGMALALACPGLPSAASDPAAPPALTVHGDRPGRAGSPQLYGVFFEEINHAGDGGLYAEMVRNRDFAEPVGPGEPPPGWSLRTEGGAQGTLALDPSHPPETAATRSLRLDVTAAPSGLAGVQNTGYWGMALRRDASYRLSFYARRSAAFPEAMEVRLEGAQGQLYAHAQIAGLAQDWKRFACRLTSTGDDPAARLVFSATASGSLWLDVVSLFPMATWKHRPNGLRADLAADVSALHPGFVRFPGGCYVEGGDSLKNAFRWKQTLGDIAARPGHLNANWGYWSSDGLGFHEYLQWCEDMGATPLFVVNCGMAHHDLAPLDRLQPWVQDTLDAIEYANGSVTSRWGAQRAKNGHPAPFGLKYIEVGNENGLFGGFGGTREQYIERYRIFYDAIKARYLDIKIIADTRGPYPMDLVDDHYYNSPGWFWMNAHLYDDYDRNGPAVYVGEYAVTQDCGRGNLRAALAEAAFLTGLERNADVVKMASYAPLFVNANDRNWNPDAIVFDSAAAYGTPSYYVQKVFAANRPDVILPVDLPQDPAQVTRGGIGLGTWRTQAEFKNIEVFQNGRTVYKSDFTRGAPDWQPLRGDWQVVDGAYRQTAEGEDERALLKNPALAQASDYTLHLKARKLGGAEGFLILFRARDADNWIWWNLGGWGNREDGIEEGRAGSKLQVGCHVPGSIETDHWYDIRIEAEGTHFRCYLDGKLAQEAEERSLPTLEANAGRIAKTSEIVMKVVNGAETPRALTIHLRGVDSILPEGQATTLTAPSLDAENSLAHPASVIPMTRSVSGLTPQFTYTFPPRSLTVLRLRTR
ncbi:MAG TPA: alpha-L-arabinofuranosidase C-terminal domain-containing protein [Chthonomonadaceae bacterium]|nr:alpha-L-arabinofuranosidase C-terminal domain-containing protein [Chthonomonadaceae bacterium]